MSKVRLLFLLLSLPLFLIAVYGLGNYVKQKTSKSVTGPIIISPTPFNVAQADTNSQDMAVLTKESGEVKYKLPDATEFQILASDEVNVPTGTTVKTGTDSLAHVIFPNNSLMSLSKDTEVVINFKETGINIFQVLGNTWHRVEKVLEGQTYQVETANTLATVRGTEFNVGILPDNGSEVYVMESVVDVSKIEKVDGEMKVDETQKVQKDKHIFLKKADSAKPMKVIDLPAEKKNTAWFKRNMRITEELKKAEANAEATGKPETDSKKDVMKHVVREKVMEEMKQDKDLEKELKKIDQTFKSPQSDSSQGKVRGVSTEQPSLLVDEKKMKPHPPRRSR